jgi:WD40 repeat protein
MIELRRDGRQLLSSSYLGAVKLWDTETQQELLLLRGHTATVDEVRFQPGGSLIATASWDHTVRPWNGETGENVRILQGHNARVTRLDFHPDGTRLASLGADGTVRIWDASTGNALHTIEYGASDGFRLAFSPDGAQLAAATIEGAPVWRTTDWKQIYHIDAHKQGTRCVAYSPDGRTIATCSISDRQIALTDAATGRLLGKLGGEGSPDAHTGIVYFVHFSPDGQRLLSTSRDGHLKVWDVNRRELVGEEPFKPWFPMAALFFPDGNRVAVSGYGSTSVHLLPVAAQQKQALEIHNRLREHSHEKSRTKGG